jgi:hypothetical protein
MNMSKSGFMGLLLLPMIVLVGCVTVEPESTHSLGAQAQATKGDVCKRLVQSFPVPEGHRPAEVDLADPEVSASLKVTLGAAVGRAKVELGPQGAGWSSVVTVLPPAPGPYETHSTVMPDPFDIIVSENRCTAIRRSTGDAYELKVACRSRRTSMWVDEETFKAAQACE